MIYRSDAQLSKASSVRTTRTFRPDLPLCREASNCFSLHPSRHFSSMFERHSMFDQLWDFFLKHRYGKIAATARTMWIPVRTPSSIRQVAYSKFRRLDDSLHGLDTQSLIMEIACSWSVTVRIRGENRPDATQDRKEFQRYFGKPITQLSVRTSSVYRPNDAKVFQARRLLEPAAYK